MAKLTFTNHEAEVLRQLDRRFHKGATWVEFREIEAPKGESEQWCDAFLWRLKTYGLIEFDTRQSFEINPKLAELVYELDHPPTPNYWKSTVEWWFSKKWSAPVTAVVILLPILVQWVEMLMTAIAWLKR